MRIYIYICMYVCADNYVDIYTYICTYFYIYMYIYISRDGGRERERERDAHMIWTCMYRSCLCFFGVAAWGGVRGSSDQWTYEATRLIPQPWH